jgi:hypothetical protein
MTFTGQLGTASSPPGRIELGKGPVVPMPRVLNLTGSQAGVALSVSGQAGSAVRITGSV